MWIMGIDVGTTGSKVVIFDEDWNAVSSAYRDYPLCYIGSNWLEIDMELVWNRIREAIIEANFKIDSKKIGALAVSAVGDIIVPTDVDGKQERMAIVDFDPRGTEEIKLFSQSFGIKKLFNITGMPPLFINSLSKILWLKQKEPALFNRVTRWATVEDFILYKMGTKPVASYSIAARTMLFDIRKMTWVKEILSAAGIDRGKLPDIAPSGEIVGEIPHAMARELGFKNKVTVCTGAHDMVCAAIGSGLTNKHTRTAVDIDGTIEGIVVTLKEPNTNDVMLENLYPCYPSYDGYVTFSVNLTASCVLNWFRDELYQELKIVAKKGINNIYDLILKDLEPSKPGSITLIPQFSGSGNPYFNPSAKGLIYGLTLDTTRNNIIQGLMEGLCYEVKMHLDGFKKAGIVIEKLICVGGGSNSEDKLQLKANITGLKMIRVGITEASALGAAALAAKAIGLVADPIEAVNRVLSVKKVLEPSPQAENDFKQSYERYKVLNGNKHIFEKY